MQSIMKFRFIKRGSTNLSYKYFALLLCTVCKFPSGAKLKFVGTNFDPCLWLSFQINIAPVLDTNCGLPFGKTDALTYDIDQKLWKNSHEGGLTAMENSLCQKKLIFSNCFDLLVALGGWYRDPKNRF